MIVKQKHSWIRTLFEIRGSSLRETFPRILVITTISTVVTLIELFGPWRWYSLTATPFLLIGVALSIFFGLRNSAAYDRYWEARTFWGGLVNTTRSLIRQTSIFVTAPPSGEEAVREFQQEITIRTIAYVHALRHHLRNSDPFPDLGELLTREELESLKTQGNVPIAMLHETGTKFRDAWRAGWINDFHLPTLEASLVSLTDIQGGCERIKSTPFPWLYTVLLHRIVATYCLTLTFGLVETIGILTPAVVFLISHAFFGLDAIGDEIEDPFGPEPQHLPLATLSTMIEANLRQLTGDPRVPEIPTPVNGVLM